MGIEINYNHSANKTTPGELDKIAVVYARYSSHRQSEQSIEGQLAAAQTYAAARGYTIIHEYIDRAMSGRNDDREEFQQMLADCKQKKFSTIITWKVDRIGRNKDEIVFNKYIMRKAGVHVEYVAETVPDAPEGVIIESLLEGMAEYYALQLSQNVRRGVRESAKRCLFTGGRVPLGYRPNRDHVFELDPDTAPLVKRIFQMYGGGYTITEIVAQLNAEGLHTKSGDPFTKSSLRTVLRNEKYIGVYDFKNGEIRIENGIPAIIDKELFYRCQELLKRNQRAPGAGWNKSDYLLTNKLYCGTCGAQMVGESGTGKSGAKYSYYLCANHKHNNGCRRKAIRQEPLEKYILDQVKAVIMDDDVIDFITELVWDYHTKRCSGQQEEATLTAQLKEVESATTNLSRAIEAGMPITEMTKERLTELDAQRTALKAALAKLQLEKGIGFQKEQIRFMLLDFRKLDYSDPKCQRRLLDVFVNSIFITDDDITINFNYSGGTVVISFPEYLKSRNTEANGVFVHRALMFTTYFFLCFFGKHRLSFRQPVLFMW